MAPSNLFTHIFLLFAFTATTVPGEGKLRHNLSEELGLTHSCVKRVLATCSKSLPRSVHTPEERSCDSPQTEGLVETLKESTSGQKALLQFLKEWLGTNTEQQQTLRDMKSNVQSLKEVVSHSSTIVQTMNETMIQSIKEFESTRGTFKEMKDEMQVLKDLIKKIGLQDSAISELQKSLNNLEQKMEKENNTKIQELEDFLEKLRKVMDSNNKQQLGILQMVTSLPSLIIHAPKNCADLLKHGDTASGVRTVYPSVSSQCQPVSVLCDQTSDGGGWTVFQHRDDLPKREDFYRNWKEYQRGFGDIEGEFWLGLDNIHALVTGTPMELRVDLEDFDGQKKWAKYEVFSIEDAADKYRLHLEGYSGDVVDSLMKRHSGMVFSTKDQDNDNWNKHCAQVRRGGWWYDACTDSNLNGFPYRGVYESSGSSDHDGIQWNGFPRGRYSLKKVAMKLRPKIKI